jgi:hypothetical protein
LGPGCAGCSSGTLRTRGARRSWRSGWTGDFDAAGLGGAAATRGGESECKGEDSLVEELEDRYTGPLASAAGIKRLSQAVSRSSIEPMPRTLLVA